MNKVRFTNEDGSEIEIVDVHEEGEGEDRFTTFLLKGINSDTIHVSYSGATKDDLRKGLEKTSDGV